MGYRHINNFYADRRILMFKECYALEKLHGTSAHVTLKKVVAPDGVVTAEVGFFSGGAKHNTFVGIFDQDALKKAFLVLPQERAIVYGEAYGGSMQAMSETYGKALKFCAFDVLLPREGTDEEKGAWLSVPDAEAFVLALNLEFAAYERGPATPEFLDAQRDLPSRQAARNGIMEPKRSEGIVARPILEYRDYRGNRIECKHKNPEFSERKSKKDTQAAVDPAQVEVLAKADAIADEWVTEHRGEHVLDKLKATVQRDLTQKDTRAFIDAMVADVLREGAGEIMESREGLKAISKAISTAAAKVFQQLLRKANP